jgi:hypothetical protein
MPGDSRQFPRIAAETAFLAVFFPLLALYAMHPNWDIDVFWHMKTGEWIVDHRALPHTDVFSATDPSRPWTPFQWLYEVVVDQVSARAGFAAVRILHAAVFLAAFALFYRAFRRALPSALAASVLLVLALVLSEDRLRVRPEAFNFLFLAAALPSFLPGPGNRIPWGRIAGLAVLSALWANVHGGGALILPICVAALLAGRVVGRVANPGQGNSGVRSALWMLAATALPMLPMPGFLDGVSGAFGMVEGSADLIPEWSPPIVYLTGPGSLTLHSLVCGAVPYLVPIGLCGAVAASVLRRGWRTAAIRHDPGVVAVALVLAILATRSARFIYLDATALALAAVAWREAVEGAFRLRAGRLVALVLSAGLAVASYHYSIVQRGGLAHAIETLPQDHEAGAFPEAASDAIAGMGLKGRIFHESTWGGYLIWRHYPDCTVFADGRGNFSAPERDALIETHRPFEREAALERAWQRFDFDLVMFTPPVFPLRAWDRQRWVLVYRDRQAEVFLRRTCGNEANLEAARAWWARRGVVTDAAGFQDGILRVLTEEGLRASGTGLAEALERAGSPDPAVAVRGRFDAGRIRFDAGRWSEAARDFEAVLAGGRRHDSAALFLAWIRFLEGDAEGARRILEGRFLAAPPPDLPDEGRLSPSGRRILGLLVERMRR